MMRKKRKSQKNLRKFFVKEPFKFVSPVLKSSKSLSDWNIGGEPYCRHNKHFEKR
jgi:hypothetical protein